MVNLSAIKLDQEMRTKWPAIAQEAGIGGKSESKFQPSTSLLFVNS